MLGTLPVPVVIVAAMSKRGHVIGNQNQLLWHIPEDLKRFKALTLGHPIIMGRKTFDSIIDILGKPLPERTTIVLTHNQDFTYRGVRIAHTLADAFALALAEDPTEIHIGGGAELYKLTLPYATRLHLTLIDNEPAGDSYFPDFTDAFVVTTQHPAQTHKDITYRWIDYERAV